MPLTAIALNCSLKRSSADETSSTDRLLGEVLAALGEHDVDSQGIIRVVDHNILPGVTSDEGEGDAWPALRERILSADVLVFGTPVWLGQMSSVGKRVLERMDAFLSETDEQGRMPPYGKVAAVAVVGNEDGAHHITAELFQALNDVGYTVAAGASTYWVGEAMHTTDYKELKETPEPTAKATAVLARNTAHLARLLSRDGYPGM